MFKRETPLLSLPEGFLHRWGRWLAIAAVLAGSAGLGLGLPYLSKRLDPWLIVPLAALPVGVVAISLLLNHWEWMPLLVLFGAAFIPLDLPTGTGSRLVDGLLLTIAFCLLWVVRMAIVERRVILERTWLNTPLLFFMFMNYWSVGWSVLFRDALVYAPTTFIIVQVASATVNSMLPGAFLLVNNFIRDWRGLRWLTGIMLAAGVIGLLPRFQLLNLPVNIGGLFGLWVIILPAGLALFQEQLAWYWRALLALLAGLYVFWGVALHISWLAGWLPGLVALAVLFFMRSKKAWLLALLAALVVVAANMDYVDKAFNSESDESGGTRLAAWAANWSITKDHLLFGTGPAGYAAYYMSYFPADAMATHSNYVDLLAQNGLVGTLPCLIFFMGLAVTGYRLCGRLRGRRDFAEGLANAAFAGTIACIAAMGFGDWLFPFAYTQTIAGFDYTVYSWLFMGTILVIDRLTRPASVELVSAA